MTGRWILFSALGLEINSIGLDRYYSSPLYVDKLGVTKVFVIPKKDANLNGSQRWKDTMKGFDSDKMSHLEQ
jgi:transposase